MRSPFRFTAFIIATLFLGLTAASAAGLPIAKKTISFRAKQQEMSVEYPQTGNKAIDAVLLAYANKQAADFKRQAKEYPPMTPDTGYSRQLGFTVERNDGKMLGIVFSGDVFFGGAHPSHDQTTFNFMLPDGKQVFIGDILDGKKGILKLSALATAQLLKEIATGDNAASDPDSVKNGAGPLADNFKVFIWLPNKLHLYFPEYQVASYASGPQETTIDLKLLKDVIRADWRAPAASFDCTRAKSTNEKAVCADAALALLDRQLGDAYDIGLQNSAFDPDGQKKLLAEQRAFVATTAKTCTGDKPGPCLTKAYTARLAALQAPYQ